MSESELETDQLSILELLFLSATNLNKIEWDDLLELFNNCDYSESQENQLKILEGTVNHPLVKKYPLKLSYQQYFLKLIVKKLEERGIEVSEQLYQKYVELLNKDAKEEAGCYHYKHYRLPNKNYITLSEKSSIISQGTTGLCSWQGALALTNWLWENKCLIEGKTVLELGSGIGLAGLSLLSFCEPAHFYFSDCHPEVLKQLQTNVKLNLEQLHTNAKSNSEQLQTNVKLNLEQDGTAGQDCNTESERDTSFLFWKTKHRGIDVGIFDLPWESVAENKPNIRPDIIMASDVVYDSSLFGSLIDTLVYFLEVGTNCAILVCTVRNEATLKNFIELAGDSGLIVTELAKASPCLGYPDSDEPIKTFRITSVAKE